MIVNIKRNAKITFKNGVALNYKVKLPNKGLKMQNGQIKLIDALLIILLSFTAATIFAEEKIIQQETLSFEKCLEVIATSEDKLSIAPKIEEISDLKRVAVFILNDGTLTITCDGQEGNVTVSTNTD